MCKSLQDENGKPTELGIEITLSFKKSQKITGDSDVFLKALLGRHLRIGITVIPKFLCTSFPRSLDRLTECPDFRIT